MSGFELQLFGSPRLRLDGEAVGLQRRKVWALLAYLVRSQEPQSREKLATLLWPEFDQSKALSNLRRELTRIRKDVGGILATDRLQIGIDPLAPLSVDVSQFEALSVSADHHDHVAACELYTDDFMAGFTLADCHEFDDWQYFQRIALQQRFSETLQKIIDVNAAEGRYEAGLSYVRRWVSLDPLNEVAQRRLIQYLALLEQTSAALRQFEKLKVQLDAEMGIPPDAETVELAESIRQNRFERPAGITPAKPLAMHDAKAVAEVVVQHNLPQRTTPFFGREEEIAAILRRLQDPTCRLLTLVGQGGIGKTDLALKIGQALVDREVEFAPPLEGVYAIMLQPVRHRNDLLMAIGTGFDIHFSAEDEHSREHQLIAWLGDRSILLILDNFEHLIDEVDLLANLIEAVPGLKILITSREALMLRNEWIHPIGGLTYPDAEPKADRLLSYGAIGLFNQCASRVQVNFDLMAEKRPVIEICRLVGGSPLGVELAAGWTRMLSPVQVATEIERSLDFLTAQNRDIPQRHRSIRAVLNQSWEMLAPPEQAVLQALSIFRGGFDLPAVEAIAQGSLPILANLVDKSILSVEPDQRYGLHELTRQFAEEKLVKNGQKERVAATHAAYYLRWVAAQQVAIHGPQPRRAFQKMRQNYDNIREAWSYTIFETDQMPERAVIDTLTDFYDHAGFYDGHIRFGEAFRHLSNRVDRSNVEMATGLLDLMYGYIVNAVAYSGCPDADEVLAEIDTLADAIDQPMARATAAFAHASTHLYLQNQQLSIAAFRRCIDYLDQIDGNRDADFLRIDALGLMGEMFGWQRQFEASLAAVDRSLALMDREDVRRRAIGESHLAVPYFYEEMYDRAAQLWQASAALFEELGEYSRTARTLNNLSFVLLYQERYTEALAVCLRALEIFERMTDVRDKIFATDTLGEIYLGLGRYTDARASFQVAADWAKREEIANELFLFETNLALVDLAEGVFAAGLERMAKVKTLHREETPMPYVIKSLRVSGDLNTALGRYEAALAFYDEALALVGAEDRYHRAQLLVHKARALIEMGQRPAAEPLLKEGIHLSEATGRLSILTHGEALLGASDGPQA